MSENIQPYIANKVPQPIKEKVLSAANAMVAEGIENPTNEQVREKMGGGSLSHISPAMREWRESKKAQVAAALEMPSDLKKAVESSLSQIWSTASKLATTASDNYRKEADIAIEVATNERDEALLEIIRLEKSMNDLEKTLTEKDQTISQTNTQLDKEKSDNAQQNSINAALQVRIDERENQIKDLKDNIKEAREDNKKLQGELIEIAKR